MTESTIKRAQETRYKLWWEKRLREWSGRGCHFRIEKLCNDLGRTRAELAGMIGTNEYMFNHAIDKDRLSTQTKILLAILRSMADERAIPEARPLPVFPTF